MPSPSIPISSPAPADGARHGRLWRLFHTVRWSLRLLASALIVLLGAILYLSVCGFPRVLTDRWMAELRRQGYQVEVGRLTFDVMGGVAARQVRWFENAEAPWPFLEADEVALRIPFIHLLVNRPAPWKLWIRDGSIRYGTEGSSVATNPLRDLVLRKVDAVVLMDDSGVTIPDFHGRLLGIQWNGAGTVVSPPAATNRIRANPADVFRQVKKLGPAWLPQAVEQLNGFRFETPPQSTVRFVIYPTNPAMTEVTLDVRGGRTRIRGVVFDEWRLHALLRKQKLVLQKFRAMRGRKRMELSGAWDLRTRKVAAHLVNNLPPAHLLRLAPIDWKKQLAVDNNFQQAAFSCELWLGPAPVDRMARHLKGWFSVDRALLQGIWVERGYAAFQRRDDVLSIARLEATLGQGVQRGSLRATCSYDLAKDSYVGSGHLNFDPNVLQPIFNNIQKEITGWFGFDRAPPEADFTFAGRVGFTDEFFVSGHARASNFTFRGVAVDYCETDVSVVTNVLTFTNTYARRPEGEGSGTVVQDFNTQFVHMNVTSSIDPQAIAQAIGPEADAFMKRFRIEGPTHVTARGMVDYGHWTRTDVEADVQGQKLGMFWCLADEAEFAFRMTGRRIELNNAKGRIYRGPFTAQAAFFPIGADTNMHYEVKVSVRDADFAALLLSMNQVTNAALQQGWFSGDADLQGFIGQGRGDSAIGTGRVSVVDGRLFELRLFGQLSRWLSRVYPGFGGFRQTDFSASFVVGDRKVVSTDAFLEGDILSIQAEGEYNFSHTLDYRVQVQPLRAGLIARVLRMATFPVTKLLEFRLIGTLEEPRWRPLNFPKELFFIFD